MSFPRGRVSILAGLGAGAVSVRAVCMFLVVLCDGLLRDAAIGAGLETGAERPNS